MAIGNISPSQPNFVSDLKTFINGKASAVLQPVGVQGIAGWEFDIPTNENLDLTSDVTDHFTEDNSFINDHIVNKPIEITLSGMIGELVFRNPKGGVLGAVNNLAGKLGTIAGYAGNWTPQALQKVQGLVTKSQAVLNQANLYLDQAQNAVSLVESTFETQITKQKRAFNTLSALWRQKTIFSVVTPWGYFPSMVIKGIGFAQNADSDEVSDITIKLKEWRTAKIKIISFSGGVGSPNLIQQAAADPAAQGNIGTENRTSLKQLTDSGKDIFQVFSGGSLK